MYIGHWELGIAEEDIQHSGHIRERNNSHQAIFQQAENLSLKPQPDLHSSHLVPINITCLHSKKDRLWPWAQVFIQVESIMEGHWINHTEL